jgi:hypothetical protein
MVSSENPAQGAFSFFRLKPPRSLLSGVRNLAISIIDEHAFRPARVQHVHGILDCVHGARKGEAQFGATGLSDGLSLAPLLGLVEDHTFSLVWLPLPTVGGLGLLDVLFTKAFIQRGCSIRVERSI